MWVWQPLEIFYWLTYNSKANATASSPLIDSMSRHVSGCSGLERCRVKDLLRNVFYKTG